VWGGFRGACLTAHARGGQYRAKYAFKSNEGGQVSFQQGDIVEVEGLPEDNWQYGRNLRTHLAGWFPANYLDRRPALMVPGK
jgi:hypothetical protein